MRHYLTEPEALDNFILRVSTNRDNPITHAKVRNKPGTDAYIPKNLDQIVTVSSGISIQIQSPDKCLNKEN